MAHDVELLKQIVTKKAGNVQDAHWEKLVIVFTDGRVGYWETARQVFCNAKGEVMNTEVGDIHNIKWAEDGESIADACARVEENDPLDVTFGNENTTKPAEDESESTQSDTNSQQDGSDDTGSSDEESTKDDEGHSQTSTEEGEGDSESGTEDGDSSTEASTESEATVETETSAEVEKGDS